MATPLRATYSPTHPYVVERHDEEDGSFYYEIWDKRPDSYRCLCTVFEHDGRRRGLAKRDADLIVRSLNAAHQAEQRG